MLVTQSVSKALRQRKQRKQREPREPHPHLLPRRFLRAVYLAVLRLYEHRLPAPRLHRAPAVGNVCPAFPRDVHPHPRPLPPHPPHPHPPLLRAGTILQEYRCIIKEAA